MALPSSGPPGLPRPKSSPASSSLLPQPPSPFTGHIFSPAPSKPSSNRFQMLFSPNPSPIPFLPPTSAFTPAIMQQPSVAMLPADRLPSDLLNNTIVNNIASSQVPCASPTDPWTHAHLRACAHASDDCAACSIALVCCSCRALRYTPGLPPSSPVAPPLHVTRSRSASPVLFRNIGNGPSPTGFHDNLPDYDDEAYTRALAECDTCDNSSCPRGDSEPASWTITVEQFDEGLEEFYDRTFRACTACNRSCKRTFMTYKIKVRQFDNSSKSDSPKVSNPTANLLQSVHNLAASPAPSRPLTPLEVFSLVSQRHRTSCNHVHSSCATCSRGVACCACNNAHTAPARLRLRCSACSHFACTTCTSPLCCSCKKPWFPVDSPIIVLARRLRDGPQPADATPANRLRGGARSTKSSKKGSSSSSQSSGPGSLATAHSERASPDPFIAPAPAILTQSSADEINAFADITVRLTAPAPAPEPAPLVARSTDAPSPSSNLPHSDAPVFTRPPLPVITGATEDVPTAVPSRAPSRAVSVTSAASLGDVGIADLLQVTPFPIPSDPPALADVVSRVHRRFPLASLKVDDEDPRHFLAHDNTRADDIANDIDHLLSNNTSWASLFFFLHDALKFESIKGPATDFHAFLTGIADIWSDASDFDARGRITTLLNADRYFPKAEKEINRLESVAARYRDERKTARAQLRVSEAQLKTTEAELSRLRQAANDTLDSNARLLTEIDQLCATDALVAIRERDEARDALNNATSFYKAATSKQVSRYQHLSDIADSRNKRIEELEREAKDKDAYVVKTEQEHAAIYREREAAERQVTSLKQQLHDTTILFETAREARANDHKDFDERVVAFKARISELTAQLDLLPPGEADLRAAVTNANERAGIAEEEYRKKSAEFKAAIKEVSAMKKELASIKAKQAEPP
ncbi:hypothetical protein AX14_002052 [Amanita brunnescens Koide BX004]|nr:hypothetical protein AX14_002052 [Amanita brunnescens Koide BX004]